MLFRSIFLLPFLTCVLAAHGLPTRRHPTSHALSKVSLPSNHADRRTAQRWSSGLPKGRRSFQMRSARNLSFAASATRLSSKRATGRGRRNSRMRTARSPSLVAERAKARAHRLFFNQGATRRGRRRSQMGTSPNRSSDPRRLRPARPNLSTGQTPTTTPRPWTQPAPRHSSARNSPP